MGGGVICNSTKRSTFISSGTYLPNEILGLNRTIIQGVGLVARVVLLDAGNNETMLLQYVKLKQYVPICEADH